jgi:phosphotransferase system enzyme I (PtsI)
MARALSLPAVVGAQGATKFLANGDRIVVDGLRGVVVLRPNAEQIIAAEERRRRYALFVRSLDAHRDQPSSMQCGTPVALRANIELPTEALIARRAGRGRRGALSHRVSLRRPSACRRAKTSSARSTARS